MKKIYCACSCGQELEPFDKYGRPHRFIHGHQSRLYGFKKDHRNYFNNHSDETKRRIGLAHKGKKMSEEAKKKMSKSRTGKKAWNKGLIGFNKGHIVTESTRLKISIANKNKSSKNKGEMHYNWKGGITSINEKIRKSLEYKIWRRAVWERDKYACVWCGKTKCAIHADHIKPFSLFPELRFAIDNGRTLCKECHRKTETYGGKCFKIKNDRK